MPHTHRTVFFVSQEGITLGLPSNLLGTPFLIDEDGQFVPRINDYLFARRNGDWGGRIHLNGAQAEAHGVRVLRASLLYLKNRAYQLDSFRRWCSVQNLDMVTISESDLDLYADSMEQEKPRHSSGLLRPSSVNQNLTSIIDFLAFACARGWRGELGLAVLPRARRSAIPQPQHYQRLRVFRRVHPQEVTTWYTEAEIEKFIEYFDQAATKIVAKTLARTGMRISEVLSIRVQDVPSLENWKQDRAYQRLQVIGKFGKRRHVVLDEEITKALNAFIDNERKTMMRKATGNTELLFLGRIRRKQVAPLSIKYVQAQFVRARKDAGMEGLTPHLLRHHFAAHFLIRAWKRETYGALYARPFSIESAQGVLSGPLISLMQTLGHTSIETTSKYLYALPDLMGGRNQEAFETALDQGVSL